MPMPTTTRYPDLPRGLELLQLIGEVLDDDDDLRVHREGLVVPDQASSSSNAPRPPKGGEDDEREGQARRSEAGSRRGTAERGSRRRQRPEGEKASLVSGAGLTPEEQADLREAADAYPQMRVGTASGAAWIEMWVKPVSGLEDSAYLLIQYPADKEYPVRGWGWWDSGIWIGPRHTNYPHGDICAYNPNDLTWNRAGPLVALLNLYAIWVVRHLHLREFGRWPGLQRIHTAYERLREHEPGEFCGCGRMTRYQDCCRQEDERMAHGERYATYHEHLDKLDDPSRRPPPLVNRPVPTPEELIEPISP